MPGITQGALVLRRGAPPDLPLSPVGAANPSAPKGAHPPWPYLCGALPAHCCLQVESLRILLLAEQALREGLEEALARRSALDLVLSCPGSVPFMQTALGSPRLRLCPFCPASSSGTCPARGARRQAGSRLPPPRTTRHRFCSAPRLPSPKAKPGLAAEPSRTPGDSPKTPSPSQGLPLPRFSAPQQPAVPSSRCMKNQRQPGHGRHRAPGQEHPVPPAPEAAPLSPRCPSPCRGQVTAPCTPLKGSQGFGGAGGHSPGFYTAPNDRLHPQRCTTTPNSMQELR